MPCYVKGCKNKGDFRFPKKSRTQWLEAIGRPNDNPGEHNRICAEHFSPDDFLPAESYTTGLISTKRRLKRSAIPHVFEEGLKNHKRPTNMMELRNSPTTSSGHGETGVGEMFDKRDIDEGVFILPDTKPEVSDIWSDQLECGNNILSPVVPTENQSMTSASTDKKYIVSVNESSEIIVGHFMPDEFNFPVKKEVDSETQESKCESSDILVGHFRADEFNFAVKNEVESEPHYESKCESSDILVGHVRADEFNFAVLKQVKSELHCESESEFQGKVSSKDHVGVSGVVTQLVTEASDPLVDKATKDSDPILDTPTGTNTTKQETIINPLRRRRYDIHEFKTQPKVIKYFTGLDSYEKFMFVFQSLRTDKFEINYRNDKVKSLSLENQFFFTLWKLRRNTPDFELGIHFGTSQTAVSNTFVSFIKFMCTQWETMDIWLSRSLTDYYMPDGFKKAHPSTQNIIYIKGTETPIREVRNNQYQQATLGSSKNKNSLKVLSKGKDRFSNATLMDDQTLPSDRVPIERLIHLTKTYKIVDGEINPYYVGIASEIFFVCVMLCNFRENTIAKES